MLPPPSSLPIKFFLFCRYNTLYTINLHKSLSPSQIQAACWWPAMIWIEWERIICDNFSLRHCRLTPLPFPKHEQYMLNLSSIFPPIILFSPLASVPPPPSPPHALYSEAAIRPGIYSSCKACLKWLLFCLIILPCIYSLKNAWKQLKFMVYF